MAYLGFIMPIALPQRKCLETVSWLNLTFPKYYGLTFSLFDMTGATYPDVSFKLGCLACNRVHNLRITNHSSGPAAFRGVPSNNIRTFLYKLHWMKMNRVVYVSGSCHCWRNPVERSQPSQLQRADRGFVEPLGYANPGRS